jgi:hypothetical protein
VRRALLALCWLAAACHEEPAQGPLRCATTAQCPGGYHCAPDGFCRGDRTCDGDGDCCLGELCDAQRCRPRQTCNKNAPCADPGTTCSANLCVPAACGEDGACKGDRKCIFGRCLHGLPCGGHCPAGQACARNVDRCVPVPVPPSCAAGSLAVLSHDDDLLTEGCTQRSWASECRLLPPLPEGERGLPLVPVLASGTLWLAAYDQTYGDVVVARHAPGPPFSRQALYVLTGLPKDATVVSDPKGPRGGVAEPGPDRGTVLDAAADAKGRLWVVYRDATADGIGIVHSNLDGSGGEHAIAQGQGLGTALALALLPDGRPAVLSFQPMRSGPGGASGAAGPARLDLRVAQVPVPQKAGDWKLVPLLQQAPVPIALPCQGTCTAGEVCAADGKGAACAKPGGTCQTCLPMQTCVQGTCKNLVAGPAPTDGLPQGRGAWLDLALAGDGSLLVAAYDAVAGDLHMARGKPEGPFTWTPVPTKVANSKDFGRFVRIIEAKPGEAWMACEDSEKGRLLLLRQQGAAWIADVIDDGKRQDGLHRVGADVAFAVAPTGAALFAYQDTRRGDLLAARVAKAGQAPVRSVLAAADTHGFSAGVVLSGSKAWIVGATRVQVDGDGALRTFPEIKDFVWGGE